MALKIGIDAHGMGGGDVSGLSAGNNVSVFNIIRELSRIDHRNEYRIYISHAEARENDIFKRQNFSPRLLRPRTQWIQRPISLPIELIRNPVDILHVPFIIPPFCSAKSVVTIHDVCFEQCPELYTSLEYKRMSLLVRLSSKRATNIITVSNSAREDIIKLYKIDPDRVHVVYNGVNTNFFSPIEDMNIKETVRKKFGVKGEYILFVGVIVPKKNLLRLLQAFARLHNAGNFNYELVIVGKKGWLSDELYSQVLTLDLKDKVIFTGYVPDSELPLLYNGAELFVYPSIVEGFGIPPIEAMACGTPVVSSNISCTQEILGDAAVLVDPLKVEDISEGIYRLLYDKDLRNEKIAKGLKRVKMFSWHDSAQKVLTIYEETIRR